MQPAACTLTNETDRGEDDSASLLETVTNLKFFLATAPSSFPTPTDEGTASWENRHLHRFPLPSSEPISCVLWNDIYHITGTDIVRALSFRFLAFGRPIRNVKKFEEGVFSDLRNLKSGSDATLEDPKVSKSANKNGLSNDCGSERLFGAPFQTWMHPHAKEAKGLLLVLCPS